MMNWYHWLTLALTIFYIPILVLRGFRMGILGMWMPKPCPPSKWRWIVKCCEHNPCPDRPVTAGKEYLSNPWRCPQCKSWWITAELYRNSHTYEWRKVCEQVGDTFIMELQ